MPTQTEICDAIDNMQSIRCSYNGYDRDNVLPLVLLRNDTDELVLNGWQTSGQSSTRTPPCWVNMTVSEIKDFEIVGAFSRADLPTDYDPRRYKNKACWVPTN